MELLTLYAAQGDLSVVRTQEEAIIVDAHMPECDSLMPAQVEATLQYFVGKRRVHGLVLTGLDRDHACPAGVDSILKRYTPDWVMYPKYYKDTDAADEVFATIARECTRRASSSRPLARVSTCVDGVDSRYLSGLATSFSFELFSPHTDDIDSSNNGSIVVKISGLDATGFSYLVTGDTEIDRWERINAIFKSALRSDVLSAPHHGSRNGVHAGALLNICPNTVLISAGVDNSYGHPDAAAVRAYEQVAKHVFATNVDGGACLLTRRAGIDFETQLARHVAVA